MNNRRDFFRQFIGQMGVLRDDFHGVESIPLNRLNELPENIIEQIEPVFFPGVNCQIKGRILYIPGKEPDSNTIFELNEIAFLAFAYFKNGTTLKKIAIDIKKRSELPYDDIYLMITSLFFKLAALRVCHPKEVYRVKDILEANKKSMDG
jgi:hypothetical protein